MNCTNTILTGMNLFIFSDTKKIIAASKTWLNKVCRVTITTKSTNHLLTSKLILVSKSFDFCWGYKKISKRGIGHAKFRNDLKLRQKITHTKLWKTSNVQSVPRRGTGRIYDRERIVNQSLTSPRLKSAHWRQAIGFSYSSGDLSSFLIETRYQKIPRFDDTQTITLDISKHSSVLA